MGSLVELPDTLFNRIQPVNQVPDTGLLEQELNAAPDIAMLGPYAAGTADCSQVVSRQAMLVPNGIARMFLHQNMAPRAAYEAIMGALQAAGAVADCMPLVDWLRLTLTRPAANAPLRTAVEPLRPPVLINPNTYMAFQSYRLEHMHLDLPGITPGALSQLDQVIHQGFAALTQELRLTRQETHDARIARVAKKTAYSLFGVDLQDLLRIAHVHSEADLAPVHAALANPTKTSSQRLILQRHIRQTLRARGLSTDFPVSTAMAHKVVGVKYSTPADWNFGLGLNVFNMGALSLTAMVHQDKANDLSDAMYGNLVSPSLLEVAELVDSDKDIFIPRDTDQLQMALQRTSALYETLLGQQHMLVQNINQFSGQLSGHASNLKEILTVTGQHHQVPLFAPKIARWFQIELNAWLKIQRCEDQALPVPDFTEVLRLIRAHDSSWDRHFPLEYLKERPAQISWHHEKRLKKHEEGNLEDVHTAAKA